MRWYIFHSYVVNTLVGQCLLGMVKMRPYNSPQNFAGFNVGFVFHLTEDREMLDRQLHWGQKTNTQTKRHMHVQSFKAIIWERQQQPDGKGKKNVHLYIKINSCVKRRLPSTILHRDDAFYLLSTRARSRMSWCRQVWSHGHFGHSNISWTSLTILNTCFNKETLQSWIKQLFRSYTLPAEVQFSPWSNRKLVVHRVFASWSCKLLHKITSTYRSFYLSQKCPFYNFNNLPVLKVFFF